MVVVDEHVNDDVAAGRGGSRRGTGVWGTSRGQQDGVGRLLGLDGVDSDAAGDREGGGFSCGEPRFFRFSGFSDEREGSCCSWGVPDVVGA